MAYEKQTWIDNETPLDAAHMNHIECGVETANSVLETTTTNEITWDGNTEGLDYVSTTVQDDGYEFEVYYYHISDFTPAGEDFASSFEIENNYGDVFTEADTTIDSNDTLIVYGQVVIALKENTQMNAGGTQIVFQKPGVYFQWADRSVMGAGLYYATRFTVKAGSGLSTMKIKKSALPEPLILYTDADSYMYTTKDTSDTSKRVTMDELAAALYSGRPIYLALFNDAFYVYLTASVGFPDQSFGMAFTPDMTGMYYTAEYTPTT